MKVRIAVALLIVIVAAGGVFLWSSRDKTVAVVDPSTMVVDEAQAATATAVGEDAAASAMPASASPAASSAQASADSPSSNARSRTSTLVGLQPLTADQEQRLEALVDSTAQHSDRARDFETLSDNEAKDPDWSELTERRIEDALRRYGAKYTALHAGPVHCTQSVCRMLATGGFNSEAPDADWQRLLGYVIDDPPLRDAFMDMNTTVQADAKGIMYVTYLVRRIPDTR